MHKALSRLGIAAAAVITVVILLLPVITQVVGAVRAIAATLGGVR